MASHSGYAARTHGDGGDSLAAPSEAELIRRSSADLLSLSRLNEITDELNLNAFVERTHNSSVPMPSGDMGSGPYRFRGPQDWPSDWERQYAVKTDQTDEERFSLVRAGNFPRPPGSAAETPTHHLAPLTTSGTGFSGASKSAQLSGFRCSSKSATQAAWFAILREGSQTFWFNQKSAMRNGTIQEESEILVMEAVYGKPIQRTGVRVGFYPRHAAISASLDGIVPGAGASFLPSTRNDTKDCPLEVKHLRNLYAGSRSLHMAKMRDEHRVQLAIQIGAIHPEIFSAQYDDKVEEFFYGDLAICYCAEPDRYKGIGPNKDIFYELRALRLYFKVRHLRDIFRRLATAIEAYSAGYPGTHATISIDDIYPDMETMPLCRIRGYGRTLYPKGEQAPTHRPSWCIRNYTIDVYAHAIPVPGPPQAMWFTSQCVHSGLLSARAYQPADDRLPTMPASDLKVAFWEGGVPPVARWKSDGISCVVGAPGVPPLEGFQVYDISKLFLCVHGIRADTLNGLLQEAWGPNFTQDPWFPPENPVEHLFKTRHLVAGLQQAAALASPPQRA